jgi:multiple sugar transport system ATP-binding protein
MRFRRFNPVLIMCILLAFLIVPHDRGLRLMAGGLLRPMPASCPYVPIKQRRLFIRKSHDLDHFGQDTERLSTLGFGQHSRSSRGMTMTDIRIKSLQKSFGPVAVLNDINIDIAAGEFLVLVGPSGCGKSTLLRIISGLEQANSGQIAIGGKDVTDLPAKARDIAMVFQSYALYPHMTVAENMGFSLKLRGETRATIDERVKKAAAILDLTDYLGRKPAALSGGQRQRVAMGRAIVRDPKVFLFDEPLSNLDAKLRVAMRAEIKALHQRLKTTVVYVTHDQVEAMTMADRIVVMRDGFVEQIGTPLELFDGPVNTFVAQFIGSPSMNLLTGSIKGGDPAPSLVLDAGCTLPLPAGLSIHAGQQVVAGIRPEHFDRGTSNAEIAATVGVVEPLGSSTQLALSANGHDFIAVFNERLACKPGETLRLSPRLEHLHLFEAGSGKRISLQG